MRMTQKAKIAVQIFNKSKELNKLTDKLGKDHIFVGIKTAFETEDEFMIHSDYSSNTVAQLEYMLAQANLSYENLVHQYKEQVFLSTAEGEAAATYRDDQCKAAYEKRLQRFAELKEEMNSGLQNILKMDGIGALRVSDYNIEIGLFDTYTDKKTGETCPCLKFGHSFTSYLKEDWFNSDDRRPALEVNFGTMGNFCVLSADETKIDTLYIKYVNLLSSFCNSAEAKKLVLETMKKCKMMNNLVDKIVRTTKDHYEELVNNTTVEI